MKTKFYFTTLIVFALSISHAQFDFPPGGIPGFPSSTNGCPPGAWCHPDGAGMSLKNDDIDAINDALENPEGCCCTCALGKWFSDVIKPLYPDCYPNCNLETESGGSQSAATNNRINRNKQLAVKGKIDKATYNYFYSSFTKELANVEKSPVMIKGVKNLRLKLDGMWVYNEKKPNQFHVISVEPVDLKTGGVYDRLYLMFKPGTMVIMNQAWIYAKKKKK